VLFGMEVRRTSGQASQDWRFELTNIANVAADHGPSWVRSDNIARPASARRSTRRGLRPQAILRQLADFLLVKREIRQRGTAETRVAEQLIDDVQRIGTDPGEEGRAGVIPDVSGCVTTRAMCGGAK
jgi:hypothetical protein